MALLPAGLFAKHSIFRLVSLTEMRCSVGGLGVSGGSADENDHSSSSFAVPDAVAFVEVGGGDVSDPRPANGSPGADCWDFCWGGAKADCCKLGGWGVPDCEMGGEVKEAKAE